MQRSNTGGGALLAGLLLGALIGAAAGIWKAPRSGRETRSWILRGGRDAYANVGKAITGEPVADALAEGKSIAQQRQASLSRQ